MAAASGRLTRFYIVLGALALAGAAALIYAARRPAAAPTPPTLPDAMAEAASEFEGYTKGSPDAPVEIVEYADFECPGCATFGVLQLPDIERRLIATGRVLWRFRDFPLWNIHPNAMLAARAGHCAAEQEAFWPMHDALLRNQRAWAGRRDAADTFTDYARAIGLDVGGFRECLSSTRYDGRIFAGIVEGRERNVTGTPTIFVNGRQLQDTPTADQLVRIVDSVAPATP